MGFTHVWIGRASRTVPSKRRYTALHTGSHRPMPGAAPEAPSVRVTRRGRARWKLRDRDQRAASCADPTTPIVNHLACARMRGAKPLVPGARPSAVVPARSRRKSRLVRTGCSRRHERGQLSVSGAWRANQPLDQSRAVRGGLNFGLDRLTVFPHSSGFVTSLNRSSQGRTRPASRSESGVGSVSIARWMIFRESRSFSHSSRLSS